mmetsp:Transcript_33150/g.87442  ORF Transcript_33150/g.87442 Transcript_33150/m.87442 type:complete len:234 (+) Transcript_33150:234-935(+)
MRTMTRWLGSLRRTSLRSRRTRRTTSPRLPSSRRLRRSLRRRSSRRLGSLLWVEPFSPFPCSKRRAHQVSRAHTHTQWRVRTVRSLFCTATATSRASSPRFPAAARTTAIRRSLSPSAAARRRRPLLRSPAVAALQRLARRRRPFSSASELAQNEVGDAKRGCRTQPLVVFVWPYLYPAAAQRPTTARRRAGVACHAGGMDPMIVATLCLSCVSRSSLFSCLSQLELTQFGPF